MNWSRTFYRCTTHFFYKTMGVQYNYKRNLYAIYDNNTVSKRSIDYTIVNVF